VVEDAGTIGGCNQGGANFPSLFRGRRFSVFIRNEAVFSVFGLTLVLLNDQILRDGFSEVAPSSSIFNGFP
jgi:hypothetical protein